MNMTEEQFERYLEAYKDRTYQIEMQAASMDDIASSIRGMYDGTSHSAFYGMSQALYNIAEKDD